MKKIYSAVTMLLLASPLFAHAIGLSGSGSASLGVSADGVGIHASSTVRATLIEKAQQRADEEIARRVKALTALETRVNAMEKLSADEKSSISATINGQITAMNTLKSQVDADAAADSTSSLKADIKSITATYRIYALILPQASIEAAADRIMAMVSIANGLSAKLSARITEAETAGKDTTAAASALADFNAKIADANTQAQAAVTEVSGLTPDQGDQTKFQANLAALKDARAKIQASHQDLVTARQDAATIVKALGQWHVNASSTVSASTSASQ